MNQQSLKLSFSSSFWSVTALANQEGFKGVFPVHVSEGLAAKLGFEPETANWRVRALLAAAATAMRHPEMTPVAKFSLHGAIEGRRFRFTDNDAGAISVHAIIIGTEPGVDPVIPHAKRMIMLCEKEELPTAA